MTDPPHPPPLHEALDRLTSTFRGMTAGADEIQCECHWGSAEELASLKVPDAELSPDLLRRTMRAPDWDDQASVLRRVLPQLGAVMADGDLVGYDLPGLGYAIARGGWQRWPTEQAAAVRTFLESWWVHCLTSADAPSAHEAFALCTEAAGTAEPWLVIWESLDQPSANRRLGELVDEWGLNLLGDDLPWSTIDREEQKLRELTTWLLVHASSRLAGHERLLNIVSRLALTGPVRWADPDWPYPASAWKN
ncbi:hypothetical protein BWI15_26730 [Kribbella sp. ALI-6-A]|uniref:hypothetical protein n=1 Tax=Kribbella sp. ALI-6-A TaxID=1933817 RepID=UPI00097C2E29|nr:hypothetical protein [Kribbella sp. ALI-6-A]ONI66796.1 hypothetical protein BWI15_26730 [Kribbella sp. ALI-6-A]